MAGKSLMSAVISIHPDLDSFRSELVKGSQKATTDAGRDMENRLGDAGARAGKDAGEGIATGVKKGAEEGGTQAQAVLKAKLAKVSQGFGKMQAFGAKATIGITAPLVLAGKAALDQYSQLQDAQSAATQFYGEQTAAIEQFAATSATSFGVSKRAAYELANGLAPLLSQFTAGDELGKSATQALGRTADMASFFGGSVDEAATAVQSFLSGSSVEPIRRYGVFASEAAVAAKAMSMGLVKAEVDTTRVQVAQARLAEAQAKVVQLTSEGKQGSLEYQKATAAAAAAEKGLGDAMAGKVPQMTDAQKIQARYALLLEQTSKASGDYVRTSDSLANSQKTANAQLEDSAAQMGEKLAPLMIKFLGQVTDLLDKFTSLPESVQNFLLIAAGVSAVIGPFATLVGTIGKLGTGLVGLVSGFGGVAGAAAGAEGAVGAASAGMSASLAGIATVLGTVAAGLAAFAGSFYLTKQAVDNNVLGLGDATKNTGTWISDNIVTKLPTGMQELIWGVDIPGAANGGTVTRGGTVLIGERGPELLNLPRGASVQPLDRPTGGITISGPVTIVANNPAQLGRELDRLSRRTAATVGSRRIP